LGEPRSEPRVPSDVERLLTDLRDAPGDVVLDPSRVDARASDQFLQDVGEQVDGVVVAKRASALSDRRSHRLVDHGFTDLGHATAPRGYLPIGNLLEPNLGRVGSFVNAAGA